jgi:hypothetical protein
MQTRFYWLGDQIPSTAARSPTESDFNQSRKFSAISWRESSFVGIR